MNIKHTDKRYRRLRALYGLLGYGVYSLLASHMALDDDGWLYRLGLEVELGISKKREREVLAYILDADNGFVVYESDGERLRLVEDTSSDSSPSNSSKDSSKDSSNSSSDSSNDTSNSSSDSSKTLVSSSNVSSNDSSKTLVSSSNVSSNDSSKTLVSSSKPRQSSPEAKANRARAAALAREAKKQSLLEKQTSANQSLLENNQSLLENNQSLLENAPANGGIIRGDNNTLVGLENIEGIPLEDKSATTITKETKAQKSQKTSATSYVRELRAVFDEYYRGRTGSEFYWDAKHMTHLKKIQAQLTSALREKGIELTAESLSANFRALLGSISSQWILDNLSPAVISSKFNEIRMQYARNHHTAGVAGLGSGYDSLRRAFAAGLVPDTGTA